MHSFRTLLADLATLTRNSVCLGSQGISAILASPTKVQRQARDLIGVTLTV